MNIPWISAQEMDNLLSYPVLIEAIRSAFSERHFTPERGHFSYTTDRPDASSVLLVMPAWMNTNKMGIKLVTVSPHNAGYHMPVIQGVYILFDRQTGAPKLLLDGPRLTSWRTAATSAIACDYLARPNASSLLIMGTGNLAPELARAHATVRPIRHIWIWGRNSEKAEALVSRLHMPGVVIEKANELSCIVPQADIISTATLSVSPILRDAWLRPGQHLDLVGSYRKDMQEVESIILKRTRIFVDERKPGTYMTGDLAIPLAMGIIQEKQIEADLFDLCRQKFQLLRDPSDITLFKSVGHALEDLAAAACIDRLR